MICVVAVNMVYGVCVAAFGCVMAEILTTSARTAAPTAAPDVLPERTLLHLRLSMYMLMHMHMLHTCMCCACAPLVVAGCPSLRGVVGRLDRLQRCGMEDLARPADG